MGLFSHSSAPGPISPVPPRPSSSSHLSLRKTEADFEAALLKSKDTLYLKAGPIVGLRSNDETRPALALEFEPHSNSPPPLPPGSRKSDLLAPESRSPRNDCREMGQFTGEQEAKLGLSVKRVEDVGVSTMGMPTAVESSTTLDTHTSGIASGITLISANLTKATIVNLRDKQRASKKSVGLDVESGIENNRPENRKRQIVPRAFGSTSRSDMAYHKRRPKLLETLDPHYPSVGPASEDPIFPVPDSSAIEGIPEGGPFNAGLTQISQSAVPELKHRQRYEVTSSGDPLAAASTSGRSWSPDKSSNSEEVYKTMKTKARGVLGKLFGPSTDSIILPTSLASTSSSQTVMHQKHSNRRSPIPPTPTADCAQCISTPPCPSAIFIDGFGQISDQTSNSCESSLRGSAIPARDSGTINTLTSDVVSSKFSQMGQSRSSVAADNSHTSTRDSTHLAFISTDDVLSRPEPSDIFETTLPPPNAQVVSSFSDRVAGSLAGTGQSDPEEEPGQASPYLGSTCFGRERTDQTTGELGGAGQGRELTPPSVLTGRDSLLLSSPELLDKTLRAAMKEPCPQDVPCLSKDLRHSWCNPNHLILPPSQQEEQKKNESEVAIASQPHNLRGHTDNMRLTSEVLREMGDMAVDKAADFLGGPLEVNQIALRKYMQCFDMTGQTLVEAFRILCQRLHLKAESQVIDRIVEAFSARYFTCNPATVFRSPSVVHTVTAATLMLNTDLHIAELSKHMNKADFVKNTMRAIRESTPEDSKEDSLSDSGITRVGSSKAAKSSHFLRPIGPSTYLEARFGHVPQHSNPVGWASRSASATFASSPASQLEAGLAFSGISTNSRLHSFKRDASHSYSEFIKAWDTELEMVLKSIYTTVRASKILLPMPRPNLDAEDRTIQRTRARLSISLSSSGGGVSHGSSSVTVLESSDRASVHQRGCTEEMSGLPKDPCRSARWSDVGDKLSPAPSPSTFGTKRDQSHYTPLLGFASNLSHWAIRENDNDIGSTHSGATISTVEEFHDDELALLGAPWAKEGILQTKFQNGSVTKRVKKSDWKQLFVVANSGGLYLFTFANMSGGDSMDGAVGGGNWLYLQKSANPSGTISLIHSTAIALPRSESNKSCPCSFSLTEASGKMTVFQAGTEDLVSEWVTTCNYWAARKSRHPLPGGVSNMEYGWNMANSFHAAEEHQDDTLSVTSYRTMSTLHRLHRRRVSGKATKPSEKLHINDWKPPLPPMIPSSLDEERQLETLIAYLKTQDQEWDGHKSIEEPMKRLYSHGSKHLLKSKENWQAKARHIQSEVYKYNTYVNALRGAISLRVKKQGEKMLERSLNTSIGGFHPSIFGDDHKEEAEGIVATRGPNGTS